MEFDEVIKTRRSIRKYKGTPVPQESLMKILEAARIAPSAGHRQPWHFVVVEDKETIEKLAGRSKWAAEAPAMIVGLVDPVASPSWSLNDMGIAFEHIVLTATSLGLGTCWMGQTKRDSEVKEPKERKSLEEIVSWGKYGGKPS